MFFASELTGYHPGRQPWLPEPGPHAAVHYTMTFFTSQDNVQNEKKIEKLGLDNERMFVYNRIEQMS
jgi:hypothetical protein